MAKRRATSQIGVHVLLPSARDLVVDADIDAQLLPQKLRERRAVSQIYPVPHSAPFLFTHAFLGYDPVETLWSGYWRAEPDLLVWRLLVQDEYVVLVRDFENTSLFVVED